MKTMSAINNLVDALHSAHCDNAKQAHYAKHYPERSHSTMPATSFVYEFFLFNSIYQYDWQRTLDEGDLRPWPADAPDAPSLSESAQQTRLEKFIRNKCQEDPSILRRAFDPIKELDDLTGGMLISPSIFIAETARAKADRNRSGTGFILWI